MSNILKGIQLNEVSPHDYDSDWDYQDAVARSGRPRSSYRSQEDDTFDSDVAYSRKIYQATKAAKEKAQRDADHNRLASGMNEEQLDELSPETLASYKKKAGAAATQADKQGDYKLGNKRFSGIVKATKKQFAQDEKNLKEFAADDGEGGEEDTLRKYAKLWYNGNLGTQQQVEQILDRMGWEIGELESEEGGAFVVQTGDENGDTYIGFTANDLTDNLDENLHKWFNEKWVRFGPDGKIRGACARGDDSEGKPKCLPQAKAHALGKKGRKYAASKKRREDPNPERSGKAINVSTKKKSNESLDNPWGDQGNFVGDTPVNLGGVAVKNLGIGDIVSYLGQKAKIVAMSKTGNTSRIHIPSSMGGVTKDVLTKDLKRTSLSEEELDEACWKGYHKEGNKKMFGKTYPNCVKNEGVAEGVNDYLWHGSREEHDVLYPRQANDTGGKEESNKNAVYATPNAKVAIAMGLTTPGSDTGMFPNDPQMVLFKGNIRKGQMVYLHKVPKDLFIKHNSREWYSKPGVKEVKPIEVVKVPVDQWLHLIRQATPQDLELRKKYMKEGVAEGLLNESAIFLNPNTVIVGQEHGRPLNLSPETLKRVQSIAAKHGAWYEGNGADRAFTKGVIDNYVGSFDDDVAKIASPNDPKWLYVLFANVDANNRVQRVGVNPKDTIFNRLLATAQDNSFQGIGFTPQALKKFLSLVSEGKYDFVKMSQQPATQENLTRFLKAGEALMWPSNWEQYPNRAGKIAKAATVDARDQYLASRKAGVYVVGSGHLKAVQQISGKQGVAESHHSETCPHCGGEMVSEELMNEKKDACYYKVKSRYKVWPSAYASGALVKCRKKGASNWGNGGKSNESIEEDQLDEKWSQKYKDSINCSNPKGFSQKAHCAGKQKNESSILQGLNQLDEGWKEKLGAAALAGSMALGAGAAHSRVTPDGQGGFTGGLKPTATVNAPSDNKPSTEAPSGFSKEYLQKAADPNRTGRYMISVEKAQELLKNMP